LVKSVQSFHAKGIIHRDLKHQNILIDCSEPNAKTAVNNIASVRTIVTDFGFAIKKKHLEAEDRYPCLGTPTHFAFEMLVPSGET